MFYNLLAAAREQRGCKSVPVCVMGKVFLRNVSYKSVVDHFCISLRTQISKACMSSVLGVITNRFESPVVILLPTMVWSKERGLTKQLEIELGGMCGNVTILAADGVTPRKHF